MSLIYKQTKLWKYHNIHYISKIADLSYGFYAVMQMFLHNSSDDLCVKQLPSMFYVYNKLAL